MKNTITSSLRLGVSCVLFDSPKFERILLIKREKPPLENKWSFPGGRLEPGEMVKFGIEREAYEETGYRIKLAENILFHITEYEQGKYTIFTGMAFLNEIKPEIEGRTDNDKKIHQAFFSLDREITNSFWNLREEDCIPHLKTITKRFIDIYKGKF